MKTKQMALDALRELLSICDAGFSVRYDVNKAIAALEADIAQAVEPGVNQLMAQLHDEQKWTVSEQQQFAQFLKRFPNESSQGIMSLGDAWMHGKSCAAPAVNAELLDACKAIVAWDDAENSAPEYQSDGGAHWRWRQSLCVDAFDKARAAIAKATS